MEIGNYEVFSNIKWNPMGSKLSWSHYRELLVVNDTEAIMYYIKTFKKIFFNFTFFDELQFNYCR